MYNTQQVTTTTRSLTTTRFLVGDIRSLQHDHLRVLLLEARRQGVGDLAADLVELAAELAQLRIHLGLVQNVEPAADNDSGKTHVSQDNAAAANALTWGR